MSADISPLDKTLSAAIASIGGSDRDGQKKMAHAISEAIDSGNQLLVQAGTGTGKPLAYLIPALVSGEILRSRD